MRPERGERRGRGGRGRGGRGGDRPRTEGDRPRRGFGGRGRGGGGGGEGGGRTRVQSVFFFCLILPLFESPSMGGRVSFLLLLCGCSIHSPLCAGTGGELLGACGRAGLMALVG